MSSDLQYLYSGLKQIGFNDVGASGVLANAQVESDFSPDAANAKEGAIGWFQWEGGRRKTLQDLASRMHRDETDPAVQMAMFSQEISSPQYAGLIAQMNGSGNPETAASLFDQKYERSSGSTRGTRMNDADQIYQAIQNNSLANYSGGTGGSTNAALSATTFTDSSGSQQLTDLEESILSPGAWIFKHVNPVHGVDNAIKTLAAPFVYVGAVFEKLGWIFNVSHFIKFLLYTTGGMFIIMGLIFMIFGAGRERPA